MERMSLDKMNDKIMPMPQVGPNYFRVHPKGVGLMCTRPEGLPPLTFVEEYLGEVHAPWRWFEMQVGCSVASWSVSIHM